MDTHVLHEQLPLLLQQEFGSQVELVRQKIANQQPDYIVLIAQLRQPSMKVVIKLAGPAAQMAGSFDRTAWIIRLVAAHTTIPMPEILSLDMSYQRYPYRYSLMTYIPGLEWSVVSRRMSSVELSDAYRQIGNAVAQLHAIHFSGFGELAADGSVWGGGSFLDQLIQRARSCITNPHLLDQFLSLVDNNRALFNDVHQACLCHEDLHKHNILFTHHQGKWRLATILDFDKAWAGHHEIDLARLEYWKGMTSPEFWEAYSEGQSIDALYAHRRPIYQLLWCLEFARNSRQHLKDTRQLCESLGLPAIVNFE